jgi:hypothetical protein
MSDLCPAVHPAFLSCRAGELSRLDSIVSLGEGILCKGDEGGNGFVLSQVSKETWGTRQNWPLWCGTGLFLCGNGRHFLNPDSPQGERPRIIERKLIILLGCGTGSEWRMTCRRDMWLVT